MLLFDVHIILFMKWTNIETMSYCGILTSDKYIYNLLNYLIKLINQLPSEWVYDSDARDTQQYLSAFELLISGGSIFTPLCLHVQH